MNDENHAPESPAQRVASIPSRCSPAVTRHLPLFLASSNAGKLREFREAGAVRGVKIEALPGFAAVPPCVEDGATFEENARKKVLYYSQNSPWRVFADDSGLCVDALDGAPGIYSARFAGPHATDRQNNARLLAEIHQVKSRQLSQPAAGRAPRGMFNCAAHYVCVIALAEAGQLLAVMEGRADGVIVGEPTGTGGFGYDPHFFYPPLAKTFAELPPEEKFAISHRGRAFRKLLDYLSTRPF
jgi:XTP/dITP diphosphohydrolase